jgi:hypothetical protein
MCFIGAGEDEVVDQTSGQVKVMRAVPADL